MMKRILSAAFVLAVATSATADLVSTYTGLPNLSSTVLSSTQSVTVAAGDVVVMASGTNKKASIAEITFTTTAGDAFTDLGSALVLAADPNPNAWLSYVSITTAGTYDFVATANATITANVGLFLLSPDSGSAVLVDSVADSWTGLAGGESLTISNALTWAADPSYGSGQLVSVSSSLRGTIGPGTSFVEGFDGGGQGKRVGGNLAIGAGASSIDDVWNLTNTDATARNESGSIAALAFVEIIPEPSTLALLGLGSMVFLLRRRGNRA